MNDVCRGGCFNSRCFFFTEGPRRGNVSDGRNSISIHSQLGGHRFFCLLTVKAEGQVKMARGHTKG